MTDKKEEKEYCQGECEGKYDEDEEECKRCKFEDKLPTLKELPKTTIMIPDFSKRQPCLSELVPSEHIEIKDLKERQGI